ncbi:MAG: Uma2 family endonuclease [Schlesneria sp.]
MIGRGAIPDNHELYQAGRISQRGDPSWEVAYCFPRQGEWTDEDFLAFESSNFPVELVDGCLEFLPKPTYSHQRLVRFLFLQLDRAAQSSRRGEASFAPCPIRLWDSRFREPDVFFLSAERVARREDPPQGAEIVIEVLSQGQTNRERDLVTKRNDYARAQIPEYWIVDPEQSSVKVLVLSRDQYLVHGEFVPETTATSVYLPEFSVNVTDLFASAQTDVQS